MGEPLKVHFSRLGVGCVAGFVVALVKFVGDDVEHASKLVDKDATHIALYILVVLIGYTATPVILGAVGGWISGETSVQKIFWAALTAPVILAAAATAPKNDNPRYLPAPGKAGWNFEQLSPISRAYAADTELGSPGVVSAERGDDAFTKGVKLFFGYGKEQTRFRVVVASINDFEKAQAVAKSLNARKILPAPASVGDRKFGNDYYPVIVNGWLNSYTEAKNLRDNVSKLGLDLSDQPYISLENQ